MNPENLPNIIFIFGIIAFVCVFLLGRCTANASETQMPMTAKIISHEDAKMICADKAPQWCPDHLINENLRDLPEREDITEVELAPWDIEPAVGEKVYE